jgi:hypothetical protein
LERPTTATLPPLAFPKALEVTKLYSLTGALPPDTALLTRRPFRSPHHSIPDAALIGGSVPGLPRPPSALAHSVQFRKQEAVRRRHFQKAGEPQGGAHAPEWELAL